MDNMGLDEIFIPTTGKRVSNTSNVARTIKNVKLKSEKKLDYKENILAKTYCLP